MHTNRERAATLLRAERRVQEREKWLEDEQQELDQTRDRVSGDFILHKLEYLRFRYMCSFERSLPLGDSCLRVHAQRGQYCCSLLVLADFVCSI